MNITVNGVEYAPVNKSNEVRIVILQRGWVMVGRYSRDGENCKLYDASVIRTWGASKGLGEIAASGPTKETILDPSNGLVEFHRLTEIATITCNEEAWKNHLT